VGELVDDIEHAVLAAVVSAILNEVVGPDVVGTLGPSPDAGAVGKPETAAFRLLLRNLQAPHAARSARPRHGRCPRPLGDVGGDSSRLAREQVRPPMMAAGFSASKS
jgi:hypothetical protein